MELKDLISGKFVDRNELDKEAAELTDEDIHNYAYGHHGLLTSRKLAYLRELDADPCGVKWDAEHQDFIFVGERELFKVLFVYFPCGDTWEQSYQRLRAMIGPRPIDHSNLRAAVRRIEENAQH